MPPTHHTSHRKIPPDPVAAFGDEEYPFSAAGPPSQDRPVGASNYVQTSPVSNQRLGNDQEMQSGADEMSGVHGSSISGGDFSREQGVGRAPGWRWPWNEHSQAFNLNALDRWDIERSDTGLLPEDSGVNPYVGVPEQPYSPITAMDQDTMYYENDPDQWNYFSPPPQIIPEEQAPAFTEQAVLY